VGEQGKELFVPQTAGYVMSNTASRQALGGGGNVIFGDINVNVPESMAGDPQAAQKIAAETKRAVEAVVVDVLRKAQRPGAMLHPGRIT
jgi:hypothetical protein